ncbi:DUF402 domain-containing protein [Streptomyces albiaxialis]|uniref:DUF402 domain-containing protein n=1 Tax=Streptomyces albiaxialis TaxID=329523 RepID=A0ABN2W6G4_9ACTN
MTGRWETGDVIAWRSMPFRRIGYVLPAVIVRDEPGAVAIWQPHGTLCKRRKGPLSDPGLADAYTDRWWDGPDTVRLHVVGSAYSVIRSWDPEAREFHGWYINLEAPWTRTGVGFDSEDYVLDIVVEDDLSTWSWKDEAEYQRARTTGRISNGTDLMIQKTAHEAVTGLGRRQWPFTTDWSRWQPSPDWDVPHLPKGWDRVP